MTDVIHVGSVTGPYFHDMRHIATGEGWVVGARNVQFQDGCFAIHAHWAFPTEREAKDCADDLAAKIVVGSA